MAETTLIIDHSGNLAANSLLSTKLFSPQARHLQDVLPRPHLVERLRTGLSGKLTLVSAPVGFGKTTLFARLIPQSERCASWLSLDKADNNLTRFLAYFTAALRPLKADFGISFLAALLTFPLAYIFARGGNSLGGPAILHTSSNAPVLILALPESFAASVLVPYMGVVLGSIYLVFVLYRLPASPAVKVIIR